MMATALMHPKIADQAASAMLRHPDGMMVTVEDGLEPVGGVANLVPVESRPRIQPLAGRRRCRRRAVPVRECRFQRRA